MPSVQFPDVFQPFHKTTSWDRFIRCRDEVQQRFMSQPQDNLPINHDAIIDKKLYSSSEETYKSMLASALSLTPRRNSWTPQWPVCPRLNPHLRTPSVVLDLPNIRSSNFGSNLMDWSASNYLTVGFPYSAYLWHAPSNRTLRVRVSKLSCIKWSPDGTNLLTASQNGTFKFLDVCAQEEIGTVIRPPCHLGCYVTSCAFHPTMPLLFVGCSKGSLCSYHINKGLHMITQLQNENNFNMPITSLAFSCDGRYLAVASMASVILVYETMQYSSPMCTILMTGPSRTLAWHPWKRTHLVVADSSGFMALYNMLSTDAPETSYTSTIDSSIMSLAFNPHSAELVVSHRLFARDIGGPDEEYRDHSSQLNVLASFDRVVDRMEGHTGRVLFLNWSPDGNRLATAGTDETARIWDFFPSSKKQRIKKTPCKLNYVSASLEVGNRMGLAIR